MMPSSLEMVVMLLRATMALGISALAVGLLVRRLRPKSLALERIAWLLVLVQGVAWFHLPIPIACPAWPQSNVDFVQRPIEQNRPLAVATQGVDVDMAEVASLDPSAGTSRIDRASPSSAWDALAAWFARIWLVGLVLVAGMGVAAYGRFLARCVGRRRAEPAWSAQWTALLAQRGERRRIPLRACDHVGPALCWTPVGHRLIVPHELWSRLLPNQRAAILLHELAHWRRGDVWKNLLVHLLALPHWFNPLAWWAAGRFVALAEWACDREAAAGDPAGRVGYAKTLLSVGAMSAPFSPCAATAGGGSLAVRVRRLLTVPSSEDTTMKKAVLIGVVVALIALGTFRVRLVAEEPARDESADGPTTVANESGATTRAKTTRLSLPERHRPLYVIEPLDVLRIELRDLMPKPQRLSAFDILTLRVSATDALPRSYTAAADGSFDFGPGIGTVEVEGKTIDEFKAAVIAKFRDVLNAPDVSVESARTVQFKPITGNYLVGPDGTVNLRQYGSVHLAGKTIAEAAQTLEEHLCATLYDPQVTVEVTAFNSKVYYVLTKGAAGRGDHVIRVPWTGSDTVLDAIAQASNGASIAGKHIWILRSAPGREEVLPVDVEALAHDATAAANRELLPGDRVVISDAPRDVDPVAPKPAAPDAARRDSAPSREAWDRLGLELESIAPEQFRDRHKTHYRGGLNVTSVRPDGPAAKAGIRRGDVLVGLHVWETESLESLRFILDRPDLASDSPLKFFVLRGGAPLFGHLSPETPIPLRPSTPDQAARDVP